MKKILLSVVLATTLALTSCQFDDSDIWNKFGEMEESIRDHEQRISALEELCKQMNTNIEALQTLVDALEKRDYVTNVSEVRNGGVVIGYTISFAYSESVTIYHGKDGKDGVDGYTPQIGVMKDTDNIYYWTLDGEWLLDADGNKIQANGVNGTDGITPQLKIEDDYWYISYDNGATWTKLGKATGEDGQNGTNGTDGKDGKDGDSFFQSVTQDEECVYLTLADGTIITLPKHKAEAANCKIYYTTSDGKKLFPNTTEPAIFGAILVSNNYEDGQGVLTFDDTITLIGSSAFENCTSLTSITIPDSVTEIGRCAFYKCTSLASITIPDSVTSIGDYAFNNCTGELTVNCNIPSASSYEYGAFYGSKFTKVTIGNGVTSIGDYAFRDCTSLISITIPDSVTEIGRSAFYDCTSLTSVTIPDGVTSIEDHTFYKCTSLKSITIPDSVTSIGIYAFYKCSSLTSVTIGNSVTSIGDDAFYDCSGLTSVTIPDSVTSIGNGAFQLCSSLTAFYGKFASEDNRCLIVDGVLNSFAIGCGATEYTIPDSVTSIGHYAFYGCDSLTSVTIPNSVTSIGERAFYNCTSLKEVYCKPTTPPIGDSDMFKYNASGRKIYVPRNSVEAYKAAQYWSDYASNIVGYDF